MPGMLSGANLTALDELELSFIVGSRVTKAPADLESHFHWNGDVFTDGQLIDTVTPRHGNTKVNNTALRAEPVWDPEAHGRVAGDLVLLGQTRASRPENPGCPGSPRPSDRRREQESQVGAVCEGPRR